MLRTTHSGLGGRSISGRHASSGFETWSIRGIGVLRIEPGRIGILVSHAYVYPKISGRRLDCPYTTRQY